MPVLSARLDNLLRAWSRAFECGNSAGVGRGVSYFSPFHCALAELLSRCGTCCCDQNCPRLRGQVQSSTQTVVGNHTSPPEVLDHHEQQLRMPSTCSVLPRDLASVEVVAKQVGRPPSDLVDQVHVSGALSGACTGKGPQMANRAPNAETWESRSALAIRYERQPCRLFPRPPPTFQTYVRPLLGTQKTAVGHMFRKADPDHMLSSGTTYVRIIGGSRCSLVRWGSPGADAARL